ncbi:hypothetical protein VPHD481_0119 [Vibrio phage D481]
MGNVDGIAFDEDTRIIDIEDGALPVFVTETPVTQINEYKVCNDWVLDIESWHVGDEVVTITLGNKKATYMGIEHPANVLIDKAQLKSFLQDLLK